MALTRLLRTRRAVVSGLVALVVAGSLWRVARAATFDQVRVGILSTIAGTGTPGVGGDGGLATAAQVNHPNGVAVDASGNVYIADTDNNRIRRIAAGTGAMSTFAGTGVYNYSGDAGPATAATLRAPDAVAVDTSGNVYIADTYNHRIRMVAAGTNIITTVAGNGTATFAGDGGTATAASLYYPQNVAIDSSGNLYIADTYNHRVRKVVGGVISTVAGTGTPGYNGDGPAIGAQLYYPEAVGVDSSGNVYIADTSNLRIRKVSAATASIATVVGTGSFGYSGEGGPATAATIGYVRGLMLDSSNNLYFSDDYHDSVRKVAASSNILTTVAGSTDSGFGGDGGVGPAGTLSDPEGIAVDSAGAVYIADSNNSRVRRVSAPNVTSLFMTTVAGTGTAGYNGDGPATTARLFYPSDVAVDAAGNVYIADTNDWRIRKVTPAGVISTYAGTGTFGYTGDNGPAASARLGYIYGLALDSAGNLYLSDSYHDRVRRISAATGIITTVAGSGLQGYGGDGAAATTASLNDPIGLALDSAGNLYIADQHNHRVRKVSAATNLISTVAGTGTAGVGGDGGAATSAQLNSPEGVAVDSVGNIYIADTNNARVRKVTIATNLMSTVVGTGTAGYSGENGPATTAQLSSPSDVVVDSSDNVIIADRNNHRVRKFTVSSGLLTTLAGNGQAGFDGDGSVAPAASLYYPNGVGVESNGSVYIADTYDHRVRKAEVASLQPIDVAPFAVAGGIRLAWTPVAGATNYTVLRGTTSGTGTILASNVSDPTLTDNTAVRGTRYYYSVSANFPLGLSATSREVSFRLTTVPSDVNGDTKADLVWHNASTGTNLVWFMEGTTYVGQATYPTVADPAWQLAATADFNDDTYLDLLWRNVVTGANVVWYMNGATWLSQVSLPIVADTAWQIVTTADINQDGKPDILWHNILLGSNVVWFMDGSTYLSQGTLPTVTDAAWVLAGTGDFNVDGAPDLVWRNRLTGQNLLWFMNGLSISGTADLPMVNDLTWSMQAVLDINQDGWADLIWRNTATGGNVAWLMKGAAFQGQITLPAVADQTWQLIGRPVPEVPVDVNGDRHTDLVWRHTATGENVVWYLNGAQFFGQAALPSVPDVAWQLVAKADLNRDGHPDLIWRHAMTGQNVVWYLNGTAVVGQVSLPTVSDAAWRIVAAADMDGDRHPDLVWRNSVSGANVIWYLNDVALLGQATLASVTDANWRIVAASDVNGDTRPDLIWRHAATGANLVWYMNGATVMGQGAFATVGDANWQIAGMVDVNGDGRPDLLWRNIATGSNVIWYLNGTTLVAQESLPTVPPPYWVLRPN